ncbi:MAG: phosphotransferase family protein [Candidatus Hodarchaeales archaeon]
MIYEEENPPDIAIQEVEASIKPFLPNISARDIKFHYHGTFNVFIIRNEFIFRFPDKNFRNRKGYDLIKREVKVLDVLRDKVAVRIPDPQFISNDENNPFVGYEMIEGTSLSRVFQSMKHQNQLSIAAQIGDFLTGLHSQDVLSGMKVILDREFNPRIYREEWMRYHEKTRKTAFPLLTRDQQQWVDTLFNDFLTNSRNFNFNPVITHGDFDATNILVDSRNRLAGVIDFEETGPNDPAIDFLFFSEGKEFISTILDNYGGQADSSFNDRMKFHYCRSGLAYVIFGIDFNVNSMVKYGLELIENRMKMDSSFSNWICIPS